MKGSGTGARGRLSILLLGAPFWLGCAAGLPEPSAAHLAAARTSEPEASLEDLQRGRASYVKRCGACHALRSPAEHAPDAWAGEVERMQTKHQVRLSAEEASDILRYLRAASSVARQ